MSSNLNVIRAPRETTEFQKLTITEDGTTITAGLDVAFTQIPDRPTTWTPLETVEGETGFHITGMTPGEYYVWVRITQDASSAAVRFAGILAIT